MRLVAIDPGVVSGVAYFEDRLLKKVAVVEAPAPNTRNRMGVFYDRMTQLFATLEEASVAVEDLAGSASKSSLSNQAMLAGTRTAWELAAYRRGCELLPRVHPRTWQSLIGMGRVGAKREHIKEVAERHVALLYPEHFKTLKTLKADQRQAVVDAILIGLAALAGGTGSAKRGRRRR